MSDNQDQQVLNLLSEEKEKIKKGLEITRSLVTGTLSSKQVEEVLISDDLQTFTLLNINVSPFPTESRRIMKYIETNMLDKFIDRDSFVQFGIYSVVFVALEDLSYHNFENILNLDHHFNNIEFQLQPKNLFLKEKIQIFSMQGSMDTLNSLDKLNYYATPLNNSQRGGKRLIFHSNQLSFCLTKLIEQSDFFDKTNFSHVNNVFRLNNFAPGDQKFKSHYDTPYADKSQNLYSKYTVLIYLTGNNEQNQEQPPLSIEDYVLDSISENDCIIFDQQSKHEGNAYKDKNKIFIRTELIYKIDNMNYNKELARMFNTACYMTREQNQQQYSADLFNSCVKMRYQIKEERIPRVYLLKKNLDIVYITDGHYYWFSNGIELKAIAMLVILDYFNGKVYNLKNLKIQSKVLPRISKICGHKKEEEEQEEEEEESDEYLLNFINMTSFSQKVDEEDFKAYQNTEDYIPESLCKNFVVFRCRCPCQSRGDSDIEKVKSWFDEEKRKAVQQLDSILDQNTVLIFDDLIKVKYDNIKIQFDDVEQPDLPSGKIGLSDFFVKTERKINFAACQCDYQYSQEETIFYETKKLNTFCLPDISFQTLPNGIKLSIDIFNNGFIHQSTENFAQPFTDKSLVDQERQRLKLLKQ